MTQMKTQINLLKEVRWQFDDDVDNCTGCEASVAKLKPKPQYETFLSRFLTLQQVYF